MRNLASGIMKGWLNTFIIIAVFSIFLFSCKKDDDSLENSNSSGGDNSTTTDVTTTARYVQNAILEDYTGLNCGYCPGAHNYLVKAKTAYGDNVIDVEIHPSAYEAPNSIFLYKPSDAILTVFNINGFPNIRLNRTTTVSYGANPTNDLKSVLKTSSGAALSSTLGLSIASTINGSNLDITIKSRFSKATSNVKLVVYVLESGLTGDQHSYFNADSSSPYYGQGQILKYSHDGVLKASASDILGDNLPAQEAASEYTKTYKVALGSTWNKANLSIVAMLVDSSNKALNALQADAGKVKNFQLTVQ